MVLNDNILVYVQHYIFIQSNCTLYRFFAQSIVNVYLEYTKIHIKGILKDLKFWHERAFYIW